MSTNFHRKYITTNATDHLWGLSINSVGQQLIGKNEPYPPQLHPTRYLFNTEKGRVLNEYQLLYITRGSGRFVSESGGSQNIKEGQMFMLFPGEWHNYHPDPETGWNEYWIGFEGDIIPQWVDNGFFSKENPVYNVGLNEEIISLYKRARIIAEAQEANYQQALAGIVGNLLGMVVYLSRNLSFNSSVGSSINTAKIAIHENISSITPEALAAMSCMSYSRFRKIFKEYTGFSPSQYIQQVRINMAKEMLTNTHLPIKEISLELGYENKDYFFTAFRKVAGMTPMQYRAFTQGINQDQAL